MRAVVVREFGGIENALLGEMPKPEVSPARCWSRFTPPR